MNYETGPGGLRLKRDFYLDYLEIYIIFDKVIFLETGDVVCIIIKYHAEI